MQNIKKYFMTLALLLTAVTGAWAQSTLNVVELEVPADWETDNSLVTAADLPGFNASTLAKAQAWTGAPAEGMAVLIYAFDDNLICIVQFFDGEPDSGTFSTFPKDLLFMYKSMAKFYYTAGPTEWDLKPDETGKNWILAEMPASNVELQVEYFAESNLFLSKDALADKANIAVTAGETTVEFDDDGKSANTITEGTAMTVKYNGTKKVIGVKAEKKAAEALPALNITNPVVGQVIGSDGKNYANGSLPTGVTAVAKICYVSGSNGLALALTDEGMMDWSTAQTTCAAHTPAFTGGTWKLATKDEWNSMINAAGSDTDLRDGFSSVGGTNMEFGSYYSSTEEGSGSAWYYLFLESIGWGSSDKDDYFCVRACLAF